MKKGKEWALSCVAVSAAVLVGVSTTTVHAETTNDNSSITGTTNANTEGSSEENVDDSANNTESDNTTTDANEASGTATATATANEDEQNGGTATTQSVNNAVPDGGHVSDDFSNENSNQLGYASNFHIFANEATLNTHTNGNVAVGDFYGNVNFGTNVHEGIVDKEISYIQRPHNIANSSFVTSGETRDNKVVFGSDNDIDVSNQSRPNINKTDLDHINSGEIYQDKNGEYISIAHYLDDFLSSKSTSLTNKTPQVSVDNSNFPDQNQRVINLEDYEPTADNQIIIDLDSDVLTSGTPLTIFGLSKDAGGTNIIINVDTKGQDPYYVNSQIKLIYNDGTANNDVERPNKETEYFDDNHLLWNFYDSTASDKLYDGQINIDRPFQGSVLAPKGTVEVNANLDGNIAANKVVVNAETHRWDFQDDSTVETEFEKPITIPGELPELPGEEDNNGGNIENPDEEEEEEDIDPDTGELVEGGNEGTDPDTNEEDKDSEEEAEEEAEEKAEEEEANSNEDEDLGEEGNLITNGGSEGTNPNGENQSSYGNLEDGILSGVVGNNKDESQTAGNGTGSLPQTGETTGVLATILGVILAAFSFILKTTIIKKND